MSLRSIHKAQIQNNSFKKEQKVDTKSKQAFEKTRNSVLYRVVYNELPAVIKTLPNDVYGKYEVRQCQYLHTIAPQYTLPVFSVQATSSAINMVQPEYGISLYAFIYKRQEPLTFPELKYVYKNVATALSRFHEAAGIAHLDLKEENILVDTSLNPVIIDFATAREKNMFAEKPIGVMCGSPGFIAPEIRKQDCIEDLSKCDVYSFGVCMYSSATGNLPAKGDPSKPTSMSPLVWNVILACLNDDCQKRPSIRQILTRFQFFQ